MPSPPRRRSPASSPACSYRDEHDGDTACTRGRRRAHEQDRRGPGSPGQTASPPSPTALASTTTVALATTKGEATDEAHDSTATTYYGATCNIYYFDLVYLNTHHVTIGAVSANGRCKQIHRTQPLFKKRNHTPTPPADNSSWLDVLPAMYSPLSEHTRRRGRAAHTTLFLAISTDIPAKRGQNVVKNYQFWSKIHPRMAVGGV